MLRFYNGRVLTMTEGCAISSDEVWTDGDRIAYVGPARADQPAFERQIDLDGDLLLPGFKNAHAHAGMTFVRSLADDVPLQEWLFERIFPLEEKLITAGFDMYFFREAIAQAGVDTGFRTVLCGGGGKAELLEEEYRRFNAFHPLVRYQLGTHSEYTSSLEDLRDLGALARKLKAPVFAHNAETEKEVRECVERHGVTPTVLFERLGHYDYGGGGFHCVHFTEADTEIFRRRGLWVVTNPGSNAKLSSGVAPVEDYRRRGMRIAIGTDGPSSNNALDFFREMYLTSVLQKLKTGDASACPAGAVLEMATVGGARCMGLDDCDVIASGKQADLVVIDLKRPSMQPVHAPVENLVYSGAKDVVRMTMIAGRILYENGEFYVGDSAETIRREAAARTRALIER